MHAPAHMQRNKRKRPGAVNNALVAFVQAEMQRWEAGRVSGAWDMGARRGNRRSGTWTNGYISVANHFGQTTRARTPAGSGGRAQWPFRCIHATSRSAALGTDPRSNATARSRASRTARWGGGKVAFPQGSPVLGQDAIFRQPRPNHSQFESCSYAPGQFLWMDISTQTIMGMHELGCLPFQALYLDGAMQVAPLGFVTQVHERQALAGVAAAGVGAQAGVRRWSEYRCAVNGKFSVMDYWLRAKGQCAAGGSVFGCVVERRAGGRGDGVLLRPFVGWPDLRAIFPPDVEFVSFASSLDNVQQFHHAEPRQVQKEPHGLITGAYSLIFIFGKLLAANHQRAQHRGVLSDEQWARVQADAFNPDQGACQQDIAQRLRNTLRGRRVHCNLSFRQLIAKSVPLPLRARNEDAEPASPANAQAYSF